MLTKKDLFKESIKENNKNIAVLQAINVIYITIIFLLFVMGIYFLGIWSLMIAMFILPMFSLSYNYVAHKLYKKEEINVSDLFKGRKYMIQSFSQYYQVYKKSIWWSVLAFFVTSMICSFAYISSIGMDKIMSLMNENGELVIDELIINTSYIKFATISQVISIIISYFVFTLTRQRYQFILLIRQNGNFEMANCEKVGKSVYFEFRKPINKGNIKLLLWWLLSLIIASLAFIIFDTFNVFTFDISLLLSIFIFLFIGSFAISVKVLFKNKMFYEYIYPGIQMAKEKIYQKEQDK